LSPSTELETDGPLPLSDNSVLCAVFNKEIFYSIFKEEDFKRVEGHFSAEKKSADEPELSVDSSLRLFLKEEKLGKDNEWFCPQCKDHRQAFKKFDLWRLPEVLIIHLKRFYFSMDSREKYKIDCKVDIPFRSDSVFCGSLWIAQPPLFLLLLHLLVASTFRTLH